MQLPRVVIAAVFFVIGALIAVPAAIDTFSNSSNASESPKSNRSPATPLSTSHTTTSKSPAKTPTRTPSPTKAPAPPVTRKPAAPVQPLKVDIGDDVRCRDRTIVVKVENTGSVPQDYTAETDDIMAPKGGRILGNDTQNVQVTLREDRRTWITVKWRNEQIKRERRTANCTRATTSPSPEKSPDRLPRTGSDTAVIWARTATGVGAMITGVIVFWYGGIWPRRRDQIFPKKDSN